MPLKARHQMADRKGNLGRNLGRIGAFSHPDGPPSDHGIQRGKAAGWPFQVPERLHASSVVP